MHPNQRPKIDQAVSYACPNCGANVAYNVSAGGIACEYCGYIALSQPPGWAGLLIDFEFTLETLSQARRGWGHSARCCTAIPAAASCPSQQAPLTTTCAFCASNQVNLITTPEETLRPRFLIPFKITPEQTLPLAKEPGWGQAGTIPPPWLKCDRAPSLWHLPPFLDLQSPVDAQWRAQVGYQKTERVLQPPQKRWESRTRTVWKWEDGRVNLNVDDLLIPGTAPKHLSHRILKQLYPFHMGDLVAYRPTYLAGWRAQAYETTLTDAWEIGKKPSARMPNKPAISGSTPARSGISA
jgi:DNA-directed RNA polymerase subunit RPC12/RpoP